MERYFHITNKNLKQGDKITSNQNDGRTFQLCYNIYAKVAKENFGIDLPVNYGYAYSEKYLNDNSRFNGRKRFEVKAENPIKGNFTVSLYATMDMLGRITDNTLPLKERLAQRNKAIEDNAIMYFTADDEDAVEYIGEFKVL